VTPERTPTRRRLLAAAGTVAAAGGAFYLGMRFGRAPQPAFQRLTFRRGIVHGGRFVRGAGSVVYDAEWDGKPPQIFSTGAGDPEGRTLEIPPARLMGVSPGGELAVKLERDATLARVPFSGGTPREVLRHIRWADWGPDGGSFVVARQVGSRQRIEWPIGNVRYVTDAQIDYPRVSPDGKRIAFFEEPLGSSLGASLNVIELGGSKRTVVGRWQRQSGLVWNGSEIWFSGTDGPEAPAIRAATMRGEVRPVFRMPIGAAISDVSGDGRILFTGWTRRGAMMCRPPGAETARDLSWLDNSVSGDISADGTSVLFTEAHTVYLRKTDGSEARSLGEGVALALSPDAQFAAVLAPASPRQLLLVPTGMGERRVLQAERFTYAGARWFPDGERLLVWGNHDERLRRHFLQEAAGGPLQVVTAEGAAAEAAISPDGEYVAAYSGPGVFLFPTNGTEPQPARGFTSGTRPVAWSDDARALYLRRGYVVEQLDLKSGKSEIWKDLTPADPGGITAIESLSMTPDASAYVYSFGRYSSELFMAQGL
jgi:eukaryotic-like serine/threonine-protein kinase